MKLAEVERRAAKAREEREYRFAEARHLMSFGVSPDLICHQLGISRGALEIQSRRHDADDIHRYIGWHTNTEKAGACIDCGDRIWRRATRCRPCYKRARVGVASWFLTIEDVAS